ncbi:MAG: protein kinase [Planctomycetaceae bacterium]|nr:protein kinase [Planctomycetaceae bacterium]
MVTTTDDFFDALVELSILEESEAATIRQKAGSGGAGVKLLARELIRQGKLTEFQARCIVRGKGKSLLLGNYLLQEKIGAGGMGQVFKATHRVMKRDVALKILPEHLTRDWDLLRRFHREIQAAGKLSHPNIVTAFDADRAGDVHYYVMELVAGRDLASLVADQGPLGVQQAIECTIQAARGLEYAHRQGMVHRDVKPHNLLLDTAGQIKILDLGLVRVQGSEDAEQTELTATGIVMGTVNYMAPEQAVDTHSADARSDIYSLGCTLYFMLTGKMVYAGDSVVARILAHRDQPIPQLSDSRTDIPSGLQDVFNGMLAKLPEARYQTMGEVIAALEQCGSADAIGHAVPLDPALVRFLHSRPTDLSMSGSGDADASVSGQGITTPSTAALQPTLIAPMTSPSLVTQKLPTPQPSPSAAVSAVRRNRSRGLWLPLTGGGAMLLLLLGVIVIRIKGPGGETTVKVPDGSDVTVLEDGTVDVTLPNGKQEAHNGTTSDDSDRTYQMQLPSVVKPPEPGDYALEFDGKDDYVAIKIPELKELQPRTIEAKVRLYHPEKTDIPKEFKAVAVNAGGAILNWFWYNWRVTLHSSDPNHTGPNFERVFRPLETSERLCMLAGVFDQQTLHLFGNGVKSGVTLRRLVGSRNLEIESLPNWDPKLHEDLFIGALQESGNEECYFFRGLIDEVRISSVARYTEDYEPTRRFEPDEHTIALYHFDEGQGDVLKDFSGNNHHGRIFGAKWVRADGSPIPADTISGSQYKLERDIAARVVERGGNVKLMIRSPREGLRIDKPADLPDADFTIVEIRLYSITNLTEADFDRIDELSALTVLMVADSNATIEHVRESLTMPSLLDILLQHSQIRTSELGELELNAAATHLGISIDQVTDDWVFLERFPHLRMLDIHGIRDVSTLDKIRIPQQLHTLQFENAVNLPNAAVARFQESHPGLRLLRKDLGTVSVVGKDPVPSIAETLIQQGFRLNGLNLDGKPWISEERSTNPRQSLYGLQEIEFPSGVTPSEEHFAAIRRVTPWLYTLKAKGIVGADFVAANLKDQRRLVTLDLTGTDLSDMGLADLQTIPSLRWLSIGQTQVTESGVQAFRDHCPRCAIESDFGTFNVD